MGKFFEKVFDINYLSIRNRRFLRFLSWNHPFTTNHVKKPILFIFDCNSDSEKRVQPIDRIFFIKKTGNDPIINSGVELEGIATGKDL